MRDKNLEAIDRVIATNMRRYRLVRGLTQAELAGAIGVSTQQVQKYERGINRISAGKLFWAAQALQVSLGTFFVGTRDIENT